jgi:hypothetical protein
MELADGMAHLRAVSVGGDERLGTYDDGRFLEQLNIVFKFLGH